MTLGQILWYSGYPDQALKFSLASLERGRKINHASTIGIAYLYILTILQNQGEHNKVIELGAQAIEYCRKHGLRFPKELCQIIYYCATGDPELAWQILVSHEELGSMLGHTRYRALIAFAEAEKGRTSRSIELLNICIQDAESLGERYYLPRLYQERGELMLQEYNSIESAGSDFQCAVIEARQQGSFMFELFASASLCRLSEHDNRGKQACATLVALCSRLNEGLNMPIIKKVMETRDSFTNMAG